MALVWRLQSDNRGQGTNLGLIAVEGYAEFFHSLFLAIRRQTEMELRIAIGYKFCD